MPSSPPIVLSIAGSDCSAGAGVQADLKTFTSLGCYGLTVITGVVAETPVIVDSIRLLDADIINAQIRVLAGAFPIAAAKTGMVGGQAQIEAVAAAWESLAVGAPLVVDPVMVATSGGRLLERDAEEALVSRLLPLARLITPNLDEAAVLLGGPVSSRGDMEAGARVLAARHGGAVLLKGGHLAGEEVPDVLVDGDEIHWFEGGRISGVHTHGTGCTYSSAITAGLALGLPLVEAVRQGKEFVTRAIRGHFRWRGKDAELDALNHTPPRIS